MSFLLIRTLESLARIISLTRDVGTGATPSMVNGTPGKAQYLFPSDPLGEPRSKIFVTQCKEKSPPNPHHPIMGINR
jgi:hypothetical protein